MSWICSSHPSPFLSTQSGIRYNITSWTRLEKEPTRNKVTIVCCLGDRLSILAFHDIMLIYKDKLMSALLLAVCIHRQECRVHLTGWISSDTRNFCQWSNWIFPELTRQGSFLQRSVERFDSQLLTFARMNICFRVKGRNAQ